MSKIKTPEEALKAAIAIIGGPVAVSRHLGISSSAVSQWYICPATRVVEISALCENAVTRHELRPDVFPAEAVE